MPGLFGRIEAGPVSPLVPDRMADALTRGRLRVQATVESDGLGLHGGAVGLDGAVVQVETGDGGVRAVSIGRPVLDDVTGSHAVRRVVEAIEQGQTAPFDRLEGDFSLLVIDERTASIHLVSDPLGAYPLYCHQGDRTFTFGASVAAVLAADRRVPHLDEQAFADYVHYGFPFGTRTLADGVWLLAPGTVLRYECRSGTTTQHAYFKAADLFGGPTGSRADYEVAVVSAFGDAVGRATDGAADVGLALSGGLDTRCVLAALAPLGLRLHTYTLGQRGCADEAIGARLAAMEGTAQRFFELDESYLRDFLGNLGEMVRLTDGLYMTHGLTELLAHAFLQDVPFTVLLRGHGGELAKLSLAWPFHTDARIHTMGQLADFKRYFYKRVGYLSDTATLGRVLSRPYAASLEDAAARSLDAALKDVDLSPADACAYLYLTEHHRRYTVASLEVFRALFDVRLPFVDLSFLRTLLAGDVRWRDDTSLHRRIVAGHRPSLMRVRNSNTGAPLWAGPILEAAFDKANSVLKRLDVTGYRHYHAFDAWMRHNLIESVEQVLLSDQTLDRGLLDRDGVRGVIADMREGRADHAYLLQVLLIVETWQRQTGDLPA